MPPPSPAPGTAREWLDRARGKLALASQPLPSGGFYEDLCFLTQQAAELSIRPSTKRTVGYSRVARSWRLLEVSTSGLAFAGRET